MIRICNNLSEQCVICKFNKVRLCLQRPGTEAMTFTAFHKGRYKRCLSLADTKPYQALAPGV